MLKGIEPSLRREVWKYLLGYFKFDATDIERMESQKTKGDQYEVIKKQWKSFLPEQERHWHKWRELKHLVGETFYIFLLGYKISSNTELC